MSLSRFRLYPYDVSPNGMYAFRSKVLKKKTEVHVK